MQELLEWRALRKEQDREYQESLLIDQQKVRNYSHQTWSGYCMHGVGKRKGRVKKERGGRVNIECKKK